MASIQGESRFQEEENAAKKATISNEEIGRLRATAQQASADAVRAAEERYQNAKHQGGGATTHEKEKGGAEYVNSTLGYTKETAARVEKAAADYTNQAGSKVKDATDAAIDYTKQGAGMAKDATLSTGQAAVDYTKNATGRAKDNASHMINRSKDYTSKKTQHDDDAGETTKEATPWSVGNTASEFAHDKAIKAKDIAVQAAQKAKEKACNTKEKITESGDQAKEDDKVEDTKKKMQNLSLAVAGQEKLKAPEQGKEEIKDNLEGYKNDDVPEQIEECKVPTSTSTAGDILGAMGDAVIGIAQKTKDLVVGKDKQPKATKDSSY